jgi:hypothetical protein
MLGLAALLVLGPALAQATECYLPGAYPECTYSFCDPGNQSMCWVSCCDASGYLMLKPSEIEELSPEIMRHAPKQNRDNAKIIPIEGTKKSCAQYIGSYWVFKEKSFQICEIDPDMHIDGVDVELHTVDVYEDIGCYHSEDHYMKYVLDSVHCGWHSEETCEQRVNDRITTVWAPQGYFVTVPPDGEGDYCPVPRILYAP